MGMFDGIAGVADDLAGSTDEAIGRATDAALDGDVAGVGDHLAGSTDEAIGRTADGIERASKRQFDDEPGGGALDLDTYVPGMDSPGSDAEVPDEEGMATQPEEDRSSGPVNAWLGSIPRQFDDEPGDGFADEATDQAGDAIESTLTDNPVFLGIGLLIAVYVLGQLFDVEVGSSA